MSCLTSIHPSYFSYDIWLHSLDHILIWQWFCNMIFIERIKRSFSLYSRWLSKICFLLLIAGMCWTLNRPISMTVGLYPQRVRTAIHSNSHIPVKRIFLHSGAFLVLSLFLAGINFRSIRHSPQQPLQCLPNPVSPSPAKNIQPCRTHWISAFTSGLWIFSPGCWGTSALSSRRIPGSCVYWGMVSQCRTN